VREKETKDSDIWFTQVSPKFRDSCLYRNRSNGYVYHER